jgi:hypothetical protein
VTSPQPERHSDSSNNRLLHCTYPIRPEDVLQHGQALADLDDQHEATWPERALNAENALKVANALRTQAERENRPLEAVITDAIDTYIARWRFGALESPGPAELA